MEFRKWASRFVATLYVAATFVYPLDFALAQAIPVPPAVPQFSDANGNPLASGSVGFYQPGTLSPKTVWQDSGQTTPYSNPIVLNAAGEPSTTNGPNGIWGTGTYRQIVLDVNGNPIWDALTATSAASSSGSSGDGMPLGFVMPFAGSVAPSGYDFAYGQTYTRSGFPLLLAALSITQSGSCVNGSAIVTGLSDTSQMGAGQALESGCFPSSTTVSSVLSPTSVQASTTATGVTGTYSFQVFPFGNGNGSTTFNLPDLRGYVPAGRDNMGGTAAARLTSASKPGGWDYLGASGGVDALTLSTAQLPAHTHDVAITDPTHAHALTYNTLAVGSTGGTAVQNIGTTTSANAEVISTPSATGITANATSTGGGVATGGSLGSSPQSQGLTNAVLVFGGSSYTTGTQVLTVAGGTCTTQPQVSTTVSGGGVVTSINSISTPGVCSVSPGQYTTLSDGTHTTAIARITMGNGSGYTTGAQVLTVLGGTCTMQPQVTVTVAGGSVVAVSGVATPGSCSVPPVNPAATSGGGGSGAVLDVVYTTAPLALVQPTQTLNYIVKVSANSGGYTIPIGNNTVLGNFSGLTAPPVATAPGVVFNFVCGTRGALYEVGIGGAGCLGPGATPGYVLTSNGSGADPSYQPLPGAGPSGSVTGPATSVVGDFACWANASGSVLSDCSGGFGTLNTWSKVQTFSAGITCTILSDPLGRCINALQNTIGGTYGGLGYSLNQMGYGENVVATSPAFLNFFLIQGTSAGPGTGDRSILVVNGQVNGWTATANGDFFTSANIFTNVQANTGGTLGTTAGRMFGGGSAIQVFSAATFLKAAVGWEFDYLVQTMATNAAPDIGIGASIVQLSGHAVHATVTEAALLVANQTSTVGWNNIFLIGNYLGASGSSPFAASGACLMCLVGSPGMLYGIDLSLANPIGSDLTNGFSFRSPGFSVKWAGNTAVSGADGTNWFLGRGATTGIRFLSAGGGSTIEGVDNTGTGSYQPLTVGGSLVKLTTSGTLMGELFPSGGLYVGQTPSDPGANALTVQGALKANGLAYPAIVTSGGVLYVSSSSVIASSAALGAGCVVFGGGAGVAPATSTSNCPTVSAAGVLTVAAASLLAGMTLTAVAPTVSAGQIGFGNGTTAAGTGNCPTGTVGGKTVAGCININVGGTGQVVPYF